MSMKSDILRLFNSGTSYKEIQLKLGCSKSTISYYCSTLNNPRKNIKTSFEIRRKIRELYLMRFNVEQIANKLNISVSTVAKYKGSRPKIKGSEAVMNYRRNLKIKAIKYKGGKCIKCGYNKCNRSLCFHHIDPTDKEFNISYVYEKGWNALRVELDKCVLLCLNCHGEVHEGLIKI